MDVRILQTLPFQVRNVKELVHKIISEGQVTEAYPAGTTSIAVHGLYFICGGRSSIAEMLGATPDVYFMGQSLGAKMARVKTHHKHYTVITVAPGLELSSLAYSHGEWSYLIMPNGNQIRFSDLVSKMWGAEAKLAVDIADYATGGSR